MRYEQLVSRRNLLLAWRRIATGRNLQYKRIFRPVYEAFEVAHEDHIDRLHDRLLGRWHATPPTRLYIPKPSGLQRPITLLSIDDQIVLQVIANTFASHLRKRRARVENDRVFSNVLAKPSAPKFFLQDWRTTYGRFQDKCLDHYTKKRRWIAHFDLAAFYDTISHELLIRTIAPRGGSDRLWNEVREWLKTWSSTSDNHPFHHGIPQGPIASDFLAECILLPLDEALKKAGIRYVRYVDDIRIFAKTRMEAHKAAVTLEVLCRDLGLIPQGKKFSLVEAKTFDQVLGQLPSLVPPDDRSPEKDESLWKREAELLLQRAITGRPRVVTDKTTLRYVLYRAPRSRKILGLALRLLSRYPEHIDPIIAYLSIYTKSKAIERTVRRLLLDETPYSYVRSELWQLLAKIGSPGTLRALRKRAKADCTLATEAAWLRFGALRFLLRSMADGHGSCLGRVIPQPPLVKALLVSHLPESAFANARLMASMLQAPSPEPAIVLAAALPSRGFSHRTYGLKAVQIAPEAQNTLRALGALVRRKGVKVDQIGEIVAARYCTREPGWRALLGPEYPHCLSLAVQADALFDAGRSQWLAHQNSFNDAVTRRFIQLLTAAGEPGAATLVGKDGKLVKFGSLLQAAAPFDKAYPTVAAAFRACNDRRNALPASHPYDEKKGSRTKFLARREQFALVKQLASAYTALLAAVEQLIATGA